MEYASPLPPRRSTLSFLVVTAFLSAIGYGLVLPVLPFIVAKFVPVLARQPGVIGLLGAAFALCAFLSSPLLGALSDRLGRRPILLFSLAASAVGYLLLGLGGSLGLLLLGRVIDGLGSGGLSAEYGYIADVTTPEQRGKAIGRIGATVAAGFVVGPAIGSALAHFGAQAPMLAAAGVCVLNLLWGLFVLPESLPPERRNTQLTAGQFNPFSQLAASLVNAPVRRLVLVGVLFTLPFSLMQVLLPLLTKDALDWGPTQVGAAFIVLGLCDILGQGLLLPTLLTRLGERRVALLGLGLGVVDIAGLALLPAFHSAFLLYAGVGLFSFGEGIFNACLNALLSHAAPRGRQGQVQGGAQAFASPARVLGPLGGGQLYARGGPAATFGLGAGLVAAALALLSGLRSVKAD